jgi:hypothetical protein
MRKLLLLSLTTLAACPEPDPEHTIVDVKGDRAALLAGREVGGDWQKLTADANGDVAFEVHDFFELIGVCEDFGGEVYAYAAGREDADLDPYAYDIGCGSIEYGDITVTLTANDSVDVTIGWLPQAVAPGAGTSMSVPLGQHDVFMVDPVAHTIAVRRGVAITAGMTLELDFSNAVPLVEHAIALSETASVNSSIASGSGDRARLGRNDTRVWTMPASLIVAGDKHTATVNESDLELPRTRSRTVTVDPSSTQTISVQLPDHMASATTSWNGVPSASYNALGTWDQVDLFGWQSDDDAAPMWFFLEYPHAARTLGVVTAPDARSVTGWNPAWTVDGAAPYYLQLSLSRTVPGGDHERISWSVDTTPLDEKRKRTVSRQAQIDAARARFEWQRDRVAR